MGSGEWGKKLVTTRFKSLPYSLLPTSLSKLNVFQLITYSLALTQLGSFAPGDIYPTLNAKRVIAWACPRLLLKFPQVDDS